MVSELGRGWGSKEKQIARAQLALADEKEILKYFFLKYRFKTDFNGFHFVLCTVKFPLSNIAL